jgi:phosphatidate cytidylyltransferase
MHMWISQSNHASPVVVVAATVLMVAIGCFPVLWDDHSVDCPIGLFGWCLAGLIAAFVVTMLWEMSRFSAARAHGGEVSERLGQSVFVYVYLLLLFGFIVPHRFLQSDNAIGLLALVSVIATVKLSDSFAYFAGKTLGLRKLAPDLSPGKTVEGAVGALVGGCIATAIVIYAIAPFVFRIEPPKPWWWVILYGVLVTVAGMLGDLAESLIKRDAGCKDSGGWIPGMGGILDIMDSIIFAAPVSYLIWIVGDSH